MLRSDQTSTLRCVNQIIEVSSPLVMGIINATPDSFYTPSRNNDSVEKAMVLASKMVLEGALILDVGGMSTRPGANEIPLDEELRRVIPVIEALASGFPDIVISVDTYRAKVAEEAIKAGARMINDISGGQWDPDLLKIISGSHAAYVVMHVHGTQDNMHKVTEYQHITSDILKYFINRIQVFKDAGIEEIVLDPGFGFSKSMEHNYQLIDQLGIFGLLGRPLMVGISRKSTLSKTISRTAEETLEATTALHMVALQNGASILRVHDVLPAMDTIAVFNKIEAVKTIYHKR